MPADGIVADEEVEAPIEIKVTRADSAATPREGRNCIRKISSVTIFPDTKVNIIESVSADYTAPSIALCTGEFE